MEKTQLSGVGGRHESTQAKGDLGFVVSCVPSNGLDLETSLCIIEDSAGSLFEAVTLIFTGKLRDRSCTNRPRPPCVQRACAGVF